MFTLAAQAAAQCKLKTGLRSLSRLKVWLLVLCPSALVMSEASYSVLQPSQAPELDCRIVYHLELEAFA
jgi:hypothetical protein